MHKYRLIFILGLFLMIAAGLHCQTGETADSDTLIVIQQATNLLNLLFEGDYKAQDLIYWDDFYIDDYDVSSDYWDAYDEYDEEYFMESIIDDISTKLQYQGENDPYQNQSITNSGDTWTSEWSNKQKKVTVIMLKAGDNYYLTEIDIAALNP
jgi:hypothetical protein